MGQAQPHLELPTRQTDGACSKKRKPEAEQRPRRQEREEHGRKTRRSPHGRKQLAGFHRLMDRSMRSERRFKAGYIMGKLFQDVVKERGRTMDF